MAKYTVGVIRDFIAQHFLFGGDWGRENQLHAHHYKLEAIFEGEQLDRHGYLLDIAVVNQHLDAVVDRFRDRVLNDLPELGGQNPGLEPFARVLAESLLARLDTRGLGGLTLKLWEHEQAYATYHVGL
jgi:6-pyruvoyltetrahydropterin/6-carboxytetrahydropterin synthase